MGNTEEAFNFYKSVFGTEFLAPISRMGDMAPPPGQSELSEAEEGDGHARRTPDLAGHVIMGPTCSSRSAMSAASATR